jgi:hypothetical protein
MRSPGSASATTWGGTTRFQILDTRFDVRGEGAAAGRLLQFFPVGAHHETPPSAARTLVVRHHDGRYDVSEEGRPLRTERNLAMGVSWIGRYCARRAMEFGGRGAAMSAGCAVVKGRRVMFAGDGRLVRTLLALHLLRDGHDVESDWRTVVDDDGVRGVANRFIATETALGLLPDLDVIPPTTPAFEDDDGRRLFGFSPLDFGRGWRISNGAIDAVFLLESNFGGQTRVARWPAHEITTMLLNSCVVWRSEGPSWLPVLMSAIARARTYRLFIGDIGEAGCLLASAATSSGANAA